MRVVVCGGRDYSDPIRVVSVLDALGITELAHGAALGADALAAWWALHNGVPTTVFPARWLDHGKAAGPMRNQQMLDEFKPDQVVAFPGDRGTAHMVRIAEKAGVPVLRVDE